MGGRAGERVGESVSQRDIERVRGSVNECVRQ